MNGLYMTKDLLACMRVYAEKFHSVRDIERRFQKEINIQKAKENVNRATKITTGRLLANNNKKGHLLQ